MGTGSNIQPQGGITINANTIISMAATIIGGVVLYMVTTGMGQVKSTATDVKEVKTQLPYVQHALDTTQADVKQQNAAIANLITKPELDSKHQILWNALKDNRAESEKHYETLSGEIKGVQTEQTRVREDLMKQAMGKPHE